MGYVLIRHRVRDYDAWKPVFDEHGAVRREAGSIGGQLFRSADDPNDVTILLEWGDTDGARTFAQSDDLREAMERAGVVGRPEIVFLDEADRPAV